MTIYALSSGPGVSGVAVIRISGSETSKVLKKLTNKEIPQPRMATLRKINNINTSELIDEGIIIWFPGPESYTGEDMAEIHVHGGKAVVISIQNEISKYISENNISILGSPLPLEEHEVNWTKDEINLKFEIAHRPQFKINYKPKKPPIYYTIEADNEMISSQVKSIQNQYGKLITLEFPDKESTILGKVKHVESENEKSLSLDSQKFKNVLPFAAAPYACLLYTSPSPRDQRGSRMAGSG